MKILFLIDDLGSGGAQRQVVTLSDLLVQRGHDITVIVYHESNFFESRLLSTGTKLLKCIAPNYLRRIISIRQQIIKGRYDAVISFLDTPNFLNDIAAIGGKRNWVIITSERSCKTDFLDTAKGKIYGMMERFTDAKVCNSDRAREMWSSRYPSFRDKLHTIYNATELPSKAYEELSHYTPKKDGLTHIVVAASYQHLKNPLGVIKAVAQLSLESRSRLQIDWYGREVTYPDGSSPFKLGQKLIEEHNLRDTVTLHPSTDKISCIMAQADFIGLFSQIEGLPNAICEGMMLGKPIIMSKVSDYEKLVDENNGFLCDWDNESSIRVALEKSIQLSPDRVCEMGRSSREKAEQLFDPEIVANQWEYLIKYFVEKN